MEEDKFGSAVDAMLRETASTYGAPAFGWRIRRRGRLHEGVHGTRDMTQPDPASLQDRWHWGSCAKSVCAVVCAVLVDAGTVPGGWSTPLSALDKTFAGAPYEHVTMEQVLAHRSGIIEDFSEAELGTLSQQVRAMSATEARRHYATQLRDKPLHHDAGSNYGPYSNAAYCLLAHALEVHAAKPWEHLVQELVATPLGVQLGFGCPTTGLVGHNDDGEPLRDHADAAFHVPALGLHSTLEHWETFASLFFQGLRGNFEPFGKLKVTPQSALKLITPASPRSAEEQEFGSEPGNLYALGWKCQWDEDGSKVVHCHAPTGILWHFGTNFAFQSGVLLNAEHDLLLVCASNSGSMLMRVAFRMMMEGVLQIASQQEQ